MPGKSLPGDQRAALRPERAGHLRPAAPGRPDDEPYRPGAGPHGPEGCPAAPIPAVAGLAAATRQPAGVAIGEPATPTGAATREPTTPTGAATREPATPTTPAADPAASAKMLYAMDAALTPGSPVTDIRELTALARAAVQAGQGRVLSTSHVLFPNGAVTLVLILAESHLSIHTWPEEDLIAIDLFSCGAIAGQQVLAELGQLLRLRDVRIRQVERGLRRDRPGAG